MFVECRHILTNGRKCRAAALRGKAFCFFHAKLHFRHGHSRSRKFPQYAVPDLREIQAAVNKTIATLNSPLTDARRAGVLLYGLSLAAQLQKRIQASDQGASDQEASDHEASDQVAGDSIPPLA
jgi:hypothetical protein